MPCAIVVLILILTAIVYWSLIIAFVYSHDELVEDRVPNCRTCGYSRAGRPEGSACPECGEVTPDTRVRVMTQRTLEPARLILFTGAVLTILLYAPIRDFAAGMAGTTHRIDASGSVSSGPMDWTIAAAWHFAIYLAYAGGVVRPAPFRRARANTIAFCAVSAVVYLLVGVVVGRAYDKEAAEVIGLIGSGIATGAAAMAVSGGLRTYTAGGRTSV